MYQDVIAAEPMNEALPSANASSGKTAFAQPQAKTTALPSATPTNPAPASSLAAKLRRKRAAAQETEHNQGRGQRRQTVIPVRTPDILGRLPVPARDSLESNSRLEPYVDAKNGAAFLCIHPKTLMRLAREGTVPAYSFNEGTRRHWRFLISELDKWMKTKVNSSAHLVRPRPANERRT
jgi:hypothetical protein